MHHFFHHYFRGINNTRNTALYSSGTHVEDKADCIVGVYCDWTYNASSGCTRIVGVYSDWVYNAKCNVGVCSDWVYNTKYIVGTAHNLKTKPVALWVNNANCIVGVSGNHDNSDTRAGELKIGAPFLQYSQGFI